MRTKFSAAVLLLLLSTTAHLSSGRRLLQSQTTPVYTNIQSAYTQSQRTFGLGNFTVELNPSSQYGSSQVFGLGFEGMRANDNKGFIQIVYDRNNLGDKSVELIMSDLDGYFLKVPLAIIPEPPTDDGEDDDDTDEGEGDGTDDGTDGTDGTDGDGTDDGTDGDGTDGDGTDDGSNDGGDTDPENPDEPPADPPTDPSTDPTRRRRLQTNETAEPDIPVKTSLYDSYQWYLVEIKEGQLFVWSNESSPIFNSTDYDLT